MTAVRTSRESHRSILMASVARNYGVPARRGARIVFHGYDAPIAGTVMSSTGSHIYVRRDDTGRRFGPLHPTWMIDWGDGLDHSAMCDACIKVWNEWLNGRIDREEYLRRMAALPEIKAAWAPAGASA